MKKAACSISILWIVLLFSSLPTFCLEKPTHEAINEKIAFGTFEGFSLTTYLKNNLGFKDGTIEKVNGQEVYKWIRDGGKKEDEPMYTRSMNHFHNPLKSWDSAGFKGTFQSSVIWAQDQGWFGSLWGGDWSWKKGRDSFYKGLTGVAKTDRENDFADTFRAVGQIMHLVEDISVPAHTRDDAHVTGYHYELAVDKLREKDDPIFLDAIANPITFEPSILSLPPNPLASIPIATIFDIDIYNSVNPDPNVTAISAIGLSEYTNANFVSEGLLSANFQDFPYPRIEDTTIVEKSYTGSFGEYTRQYYKKNCCGETNKGNGYLLAAVDYFDYWRKKYPILSVGLPIIPVLDDNVYKDYTSLIIPRAVGYSAGLLDYFFRGTLEISAPDTYVYSIIAGSINPQQFTHIKAKVMNATPNENIQNGIIQAVARYKVIPGYSPDLSNYPPDGNIMKTIDYSYSVSEPRTLTSEEITSLNIQPTEFTFDFNANPIPAGITDLSLQVIFKGTLGNEADTAVAVGMKDLKEPTHHVFWNATDMFLLDGQLYTSTYIKGKPTLAKKVDFDHDKVFNETGIGEPYIDPYNMTFSIGYMNASPPATPVIYTATSNVPSGKHIRLIVLVDNTQADNWFRFTHIDNIFNSSKNGDYIFQGVTNQEENGVWQEPTPLKILRGIRQHFYVGIVGCQPESTDPVTGLKYCPYPENAPAPADSSPYPVTINFP